MRAGCESVPGVLAARPATGRAQVTADKVRRHLLWRHPDPPPEGRDESAVEPPR